MTLIFGVLNVTPDSFSDGGEFLDVDAAIAHAHALVADGADWIDVGGESTAPGRAPVPPQEEQRRILPVIRSLTADGIAVSVDTYHAATARAAVAAGARIVNDVYGSDPGMAGALLDGDADYVMMHAFGAPTTPHVYGDVVGEVGAELLRRVDGLAAAGVARERIILDPGLGFSKQPEENWRLIRDIDDLTGLGHRLLVGASRKRFIKALVGEDRSALDAATAAITSRLAGSRVWAVRVHDVLSTRVALQVAAAVAASPAVSA